MMIQPWTASLIKHKEEQYKKQLTREDYLRFKYGRPPRDCAPRQLNGEPTFN